MGFDMKIKEAVLRTRGRRYRLENRETSKSAFPETSIPRRPRRRDAT